MSETVSSKKQGPKPRVTRPDWLTPEREACAREALREGLTFADCRKRLLLLDGPAVATQGRTAIVLRSLGVQPREFVSREEPPLVSARDGGFSVAQELERRIVSDCVLVRLPFPDILVWGTRNGVTPDADQRVTLRRINALRDKHHLPRFSVAPTPRGHQVIPEIRLPRA